MEIGEERSRVPELLNGNEQSCESRLSNRGSTNERKKRQREKG
jgi:hypothetical protein